MKYFKNEPFEEWRKQVEEDEKADMLYGRDSSYDEFWDDDPDITWDNEIEF